MSVPYYRLLSIIAASVSLLIAGCGSSQQAASTPHETTKLAANTPPPGATESSDIDTESTIWTTLGLAKRPDARKSGPQLGDHVNPSLWRAAHDALDFVGVASEDPRTGLLVTNWYSPPGKPDDRMRISVYILSIALRSDSLAVAVDREARTAGGPWSKSTVSRETVNDLYTAILKRARQLHAEAYRETVLEQK